MYRQRFAIALFACGFTPHRESDIITIRKKKDGQWSRSY